MLTLGEKRTRAFPVSCGRRPLGWLYMAFTLICFIFICFFSSFFCSLLKAASCKIGRGKERSKLSSKHTLKKTGGWRTSLVARAHAAPAEATSSVTSTCWAAHLRLVLQPQGSGCFWSPWAPRLTHITQRSFGELGRRSGSLHTVLAFLELTV